ncbi:MAG: DUF2760 domain-containing protein [Byssovorax sp.]
MTEPAPPLSFGSRFFLAFALFFRVLFDGSLAARLARAADGPPELPPAPKPEPVKTEPVKVEPVKAEPPKPPSTDAALQLLALFQREGRFVDFLEQDIAGFGDGEIGAVARVVHAGCRKALHGHAKIAPIRPEEEGQSVTIAEGYSPAEIKLSGNVQGSAPYKGKVQHRGWRATGLTLPTPVKGHDPSVLAPAEIEL